MPDDEPHAAPHIPRASDGHATPSPAPKQRDGGDEPRRAGLVTVPADQYGAGYDRFVLRADLADLYLGVLEQAWALGAIVTSSGAIRALDGGVTRGRSATSLHYTGRALDLFIRTGMQGASDRYAVVRDGGTDERPGWKVYCVSEGADAAHPLFDPLLIYDGELECAVWHPAGMYTTLLRGGSWVCMTDLMARHGWSPIRSRPGWRDHYPSVEWWHFEYRAGLRAGTSRFGAELALAWPPGIVRASGLPLDAVWNGSEFEAPGSG